MRFLEERPLMVYFQNFVPKVYMATPIDVVVFKGRKIYSTGNRQTRALFARQKILLPLELSLLRG